MPDRLTITRTFDAAPERVFAAWTDPQQFAQWFGGDAVDVPADTLDYAPQVGGTWSCEMRLSGGQTIDWVGDFLELEAPNRFVLTLTDEPANPERAAVSVDLAPAGHGTTMTVTQETPGWSDEEVERLDAGYAGFFDVMERLVTAPVAR